MPDLTFAVTYRDDRIGRRRLAYADDLACRCGAELFLALPLTSAELAVPAAVAVSSADSKTVSADGDRAVGRRDFAALAASLHPCRSVKIGGFEGSRSDIAAALAARGRVVAVSGRSERHFSGLTCIYPADEAEFTRNADGPPRLLLPFGTGSDAGLALDGLASVLGSLAAKEAVLYHTTWRNPTVASDDPEAHVCRAARAVRLDLENRLDRLGWSRRTVIETAEAVPAGIAQRALGELCCLICVARSPQIIKGSYVDELLARSTVPLLVAANRRLA